MIVAAQQRPALSTARRRLVSTPMDESAQAADASVDVQAADDSHTVAARNDAARTDELVRGHLPLVAHLVRELLGRLPSHVNRDELLSAGMYALVTSAQGFDASRGVPFARFAAIRIRGALTDELRTMDWASRAVRGKARQVEVVTGELANRTGRSPSREDVARAMGVPVTEVDAIAADVARASTVSLQALGPDEGAGLLPADGAGPEGLLLHREQLGYLRDAVDELPERLRTVVQGYFFEQRKLLEIAAELGVTESRVSQLRSEALALLRDGLRTAEDGESSATDGGARSGADARSTGRPVRGRAEQRRAYCAAVASRSTLASRLAATTLLGDTRPPAGVSDLMSPTTQRLAVAR